MKCGVGEGARGRVWEREGEREREREGEREGERERGETNPLPHICQRDR